MFGLWLELRLVCYMRLSLGLELKEFLKRCPNLPVWKVLLHAWPNEFELHSTKVPFLWWLCAQVKLFITSITKKSDFHSLCKHCSEHSMLVDCRRHLFGKNNKIKASKNVFSFYSPTGKYDAQFTSHLLVT